MKQRVVSSPRTAAICGATKNLNGVDLSCDLILGHYTYLCRDNDADVEFYAPFRRVVTQPRRR